MSKTKSLVKKVRELRERFEKKVKGISHSAWKIVFAGGVPQTFKAYMCECRTLDGRFYICKPDCEPIMKLGPDFAYLRKGCIERGEKCRIVDITIKDLGVGISASVDGTEVGTIKDNKDGV